MATRVLEYGVTKFSYAFVPVNIYACSFLFHARFGRKSNVRSEQALRSGYVALEYVHTYSRGQCESE